MIALTQIIISSLSAWKQFSVAVCIEETHFFLQLYLIFPKIKSKIWDLNVCDAIIVTVQEKVPTHLVIFSYKGMSPLYLLYGLESNGLQHHSLDLPPLL